MAVAWRPGAWYSGAWAGTVWSDVESDVGFAWAPGAWYVGAWLGTAWAEVESDEPDRTITLGDAQTFRDEPEASLLLIGIAYYRTQHVRDQ